MRYPFAVLCSLALLAPVSALAQTDPDPPPPTGTDPVTDTAADADTDTGTDSDAEADAGADPDAHAETETETDADTPTEPEPDPTAALSAEDLAAISAAAAADEALRDGTDAQDAAAASPGGAGNARLAGILQSMNPDLSFILDLAFGWFSDDDNLQTGAHDPIQNGFNLQQLELSVSAAVDPYFRVDGNIVFGEFGVEIEEFYGTTSSLPAQLQVRVGQFLTRIGRANTTHPHTWDFVDQPIAVGRLMGAEGNRGLGLELSWLTPLPWYVEVLASATNAAGEATARSFFGANDLGLRSIGDLQYTLAGKSFHPLDDDWSLYWGLSSAFGPNGTGRDNRSEIYAADLYVKWRPISRFSVQEVTLTAEAFYRRRQIPDDVLADWSMYASVFWKLAMRWALAGRYELGTPARGLDGGISTGDYLDPDWVDRRHRVAANVTFWPTEFSRIRVQGSVDVPEWRDEAIWAGFVAVEFVTGAHGAHAF